MSNKLLIAVLLLLSVWIFKWVVARRLMKQWRQRKFWNRLTEKEPLELQILDDDNEYRRLAKKTAVRLLNEMIEILKTGGDKKLIEQTIHQYLENDNGFKIEPYALLYWFRLGVREKLREAGYNVGEAERFAPVFSAIEARIDKGENEDKRLAKEIATQLLDEMAERLKAARGNETLIEQAIRQYLESGIEFKMESWEMQCWFRDEARGRLEKAGFKAEEIERVVATFLTIESDLDRLAEEAMNRHLNDTVARLREAQGDRTLIEEAVRLYISDGDKLDMSPMELWDYFAISYPGLPAQAGYNTEEARMITDEIFSVEMEKFYEQSGSQDA